MNTLQQRIVREFRKMRRAVETPSVFCSDEEEAFDNLVIEMHLLLPEKFTDEVCNAIYTNKQLWGISEKSNG